MAALIKFVLSGKLIVFLLLINIKATAQKETPFTYKRVSSYTYKSKPVIVYKSSAGATEIIYKVVLYSDPALKNPQQTLIVRKADENIKMMMGANFILSEGNPNRYINYPYAWETSNVNMKDLQEDCINIFSKSISPLQLN